MMDVASIEYCKELFELSGWDDDSLRIPSGLVGRPFDYPYYNLSYLLRKLPEIRLETWHDGHVICKWFPNGVVSKMDRFKRGIVTESETPEDAVCKLAIELFKNRILEME